jgi:hypothetical protein
MNIIAAAAVEMCSSLQLGLWMWCRLNLGGGGLLQVDAIGMVVDCCVAGHAASIVPVAAIDCVQLCSSWMGVTLGLFCDCNTCPIEGPCGSAAWLLWKHPGGTGGVACVH